MKACEQCGRGFAPRPNERAAWYSKRITCGPACQYALAAEKRRKITSRQKRCAVCGEMFGQRDGEHYCQFVARQTCGLACRIALGAKNRYRNEPERWCAICGVAFSRREDEDANAFRRRLTCSHGCRVALSGKSRRLAAELRPCESCGAPFSRREGEAADDWRRRRSCSAECRSRLAGLRISSTKRGGSEPRGPYSPDFTEPLRRRVRQRSGNRCSLCGEPARGRALAVHHIDYDKRNASTDNLIALCHPCHGKTNHGDRDQWRALFSAMAADQLAESPSVRSTRHPLDLRSSAE